MTPPDVNLKKQRKRHWPPIWGIIAAVAIAVAAWIGFAVSVDDSDDGPLPAADAPATPGEGADAGRDGG